MINSGVGDVRQRLEYLLSNSPLADVRRVRVEQAGDCIMLHGRVGSFYAKQMAQEAIRSAAGELQIVNSVDVDRESHAVTASSIAESTVNS